MKKYALVALVIALILGVGATAWGGYIFQDPLLGIGDRTVNVLIGMSVPEGETVSQPGHLQVLVPRNVPARLIDPYGWNINLVSVRPQFGPLTLSVIMVRPGRTDQGNTYPVEVTVFDDAGFSLTVPGRAGRFIIVPYLQWR